MAGNIASANKLNLSLIKISNILNNNNFNKWFIGYGTLLGIVRNNSCIDGDDDIDIICDIKDYDKLKEILIKENYQFEFGKDSIYHQDLCKIANDTKRIIKTKDCYDSVSIDFYMADVDNNGNFFDLWEGAIWSECYQKQSNQLVKLNWKNTILNLPANFKLKLRKRYGIFWRIPQNSKGNQTHKRSFLFEYAYSTYLNLPKNIRANFKKIIMGNRFLKYLVKPKDPSLL